MFNVAVSVFFVLLFVLIFKDIINVKNLIIVTRITCVELGRSLMLKFFREDKGLFIS